MRTNMIFERIIAAHPALRNRAKAFSYVHGDVVGELGSPIHDIVFPRAGMISVVIELPNGDRVESAMIGADGAVGLGALFGSEVHTNANVAQIPGDGLRVRAEEVKDAINADPALAGFVFRSYEYLLVQAQQTAACNAKHQIGQRLASWLLRAQAACCDQELALTQDFMAQMLGVQRATVSVTAAALQESGADIISARKG